MSAIAGAFAPILRGAGIVFGGAGVIIINLLFLFAVPLNVIALMRLMGWEWWTALIASVVIGLIPVAGQLGMVVLVFVGAYFLVSAHFNFRAAVTPPTEVVRTADLTPRQFAQFKDKLRPEVEAACLREGKNRYAVEGKLPSFVIDYCACYATASVTAMTKDDDLTQEPSIAFRTRVEEAMARSCRPS